MQAKLLGETMQFDAEDVAKFWPIYRDYDAELKKVNDLRVANILEYSRSYATFTNEKADELIKNAMAYQEQPISCWPSTTNASDTNWVE
jgi:hypothetical protein